jgi:flagellar biosynthetic protein FliR
MLLPQLGLKTLPVVNSSTLWFWILKELGVGYLIGTVLAFLIEAAILAGNWGAAMMGFSATELLDPSKNSNQPLLSRFFILTTVALILAFDMHHVLAYFLFDSFSLIPLHSGSFSPDALLMLSKSASFIFKQAFSYLFIPLLLLMTLIIVLAFLSKFNPELPIFWLGFPLQILIGISSLAFLLLVITPLLQKGVIELLEHFQHLMQVSKI